MKKVYTLGLTLALFLVFATPYQASAATRAEILQQIIQLQAIVKQLQAQLAAKRGTTASGDQCIELKNNLYLGMDDADSAGEVSKLQRYLAKNGYYRYGEITGHYGPVTVQAVEALQKDRDIVETTGFGTVGSRTRTIVAETCEYATINERSVKSRSNSFKLTGTADDDVEAIFVALIKPHTSNISSDDLDWHGLYTTGRYVAFTGDTIDRVKDGKWEVEFHGIRGGDYMAHVYESMSRDERGVVVGQKFLAKQPLTVNAKDEFSFEPKEGEEITLGVGQTIDDGGVKITLQDVFLTNGLSGTPRATFLIEPKGFRAAIYSSGLNKYVPETGGGIVDRESKTGGIRIKIIDLSQSMNTATIKIETPSKG